MLSGAKPHLRFLLNFQCPALVASNLRAIFDQSVLERQEPGAIQLFSESSNIHIQLALNRNDRDARLRHCQEFVPETGDAREDARLAEALKALIDALEDAL